jgi:hypothetical protein
MKIMTNSPNKDIGNKCRRKCRYGIPDCIPINIFWGLPVIVITLPTFEDSISARRYGTGLSLAERQI